MGLFHRLNLVKCVITMEDLNDYVTKAYLVLITGNYDKEVTKCIKRLI